MSIEDEMTIDCPECNGTGDHECCARCGGTGVLPNPAIVDELARLRRIAEAAKAYFEACSELAVRFIGESAWIAETKRKTDATNLLFELLNPTPAERS